MIVSARFLLGVFFIVGMSAVLPRNSYGAPPSDASSTLPTAVPSTLPASSQTAPGPGRSLKDAYQAALVRMETVAVQQELLIQAGELERQAKAAIFPTVSATGTFLHQPQPSDNSGISPSNQSTIRVTADQPLFRGFRDFAALRQRSALTDTQVYTVLATTRQLFYDTSTAYYNVLAYLGDEANYLNEIKVNQKRISELRAFLRIGRSRETDLLTFLSNVSALEAQLEATRGQIEVAKDILAFMTGWDRNTPLADSEPGIDQPGDVSKYLAKVDQRPEVQSAMTSVKAFDEGIPIAWGQHLPSVDVLADYYLDRPGFLSSVNWDLQLSVSIPIFQGGAIQSQVRQAESVARQYGLLLSQARRTGEEEVRTFHDTLLSDQRQTAKLSEEFIWSKKNYEAELHDYRNGLVTNLDVLQAITTYQDSQRLLDHQRVAVKLDSVKLQASVAERPELIVKTAIEVSH